MYALGSEMVSNNLSFFLATFVLCLIQVFIVYEIAQKMIFVITTLVSYDV